MTNEQMEFPGTWEEYEKEYGFNDSKEVYTNNSRLIQSFRVKQWLDHLPSIQPKAKTDVLDKIRAEIKAISIVGKVDEHTSFIRTGEHVKQMALDTIDKYTAEKE